jgi:hypothetical protein
MPSLRKSREELVHAFEPAHDEPLQVELIRDAQVEIQVERVVAGHERPRERAAVHGLQHRGLDLEVVARVQERADPRHDAGAAAEHFAHLEVHEQVGVALPVARLGIGQAVPLLGQRADGLGQHFDLLRAHGDLAGARAEQRARHADPVSHLEQLVSAERVAHHVAAEVDLDAAAAVQDVAEAGLAVSAPRHQPARDRDALARRLGDRVTAREQARRVVRGVETVRVRLTADRAPFVDLGPSLGHQLSQGQGTFPGLPSASIAHGTATLASALRAPNERAGFCRRPPPCAAGQVGSFTRVSEARPGPPLPERQLAAVGYRHR